MVDRVFRALIAHVARAGPPQPILLPQIIVHHRPSQSTFGGRDVGRVVVE